MNNFLKDYKVAAIANSSKFLLKEVLKFVPENSSLIIEQGAGDGVLSKRLIKKLAKNGKLFLIEQNRDFLQILKSRNLENSGAQVEIFEGLVQDFHYPENKADVILSSIPFFFLTGSEREQVVEEAYKNLKPGGKFIIFHQYRLFMKDVVKKYFKNVKVKLILRNVFPCFVLIAEKEN